MESLFALVIVICTTAGDCHEAVLDVYETQKDCVAGMFEQRVHGECFPVEGIIRADGQQPAVKQK